MKIIVRYLIYSASISIGFGLLIFKGYSETIKYIFILGIVIPAFLEIGRQFGFNKPMPREQLSKKLIRAIHLIFGIIALVLLNEKLGDDFIAIILNSKSLLLVLWLWSLFLLAVEFSKDRIKNLMISINAVEGDGKGYGTEA